MKHILALASLPLLAVSAQAQPACGSYNEIVQTITAPKYGERKVAQGQTKIGAEGGKIVIEVFAAPKGKTYTMLLVRPDGMACIIGAGDNLKTYPLPVEGSDI